jgi:hypothetical protein
VFINNNPNVNTQRFTLYTFARIMSCSNIPNKTSLLPDCLKACWETWDDISALANHRRVKEGLMACLTSVDEMSGTRDHDPEVRLYYIHNP